MKVIRKPIEPRMTPRKCCVCPEPAVFYAMKLDKEGRKADVSSRRFFCETHGQAKEAA